MKRKLAIVVCLCLGASICSAQENELKQLASSLTTQIQQRGKGPVAITSFSGGNAYCSAFSNYLVDRLNIFLVRGTSQFDVVTRQQVEEMFKEINLSLGKNYDASTFAKVGKQLGAKSLVRGSYTIQPSAATVSLAAQLLDTETGRIIGGDVTEIPLTGDIRMLLGDKQCDGESSSQVSTTTGQGPVKADAASSGIEKKRIGQLEVQLKNCRTDPEGINCSVLVTNLGDEKQYCLVNKTESFMSRIVDENGAVYTPVKISLAEQRGSNVMWECANLPTGVPVAASLVFGSTYGAAAPLPTEGSRIRLVELGFDLFNYSTRSPTSMFARFNNVAVLR